MENHFYFPGLVDDSWEAIFAVFLVFAYIGYYFFLFFSIRNRLEKHFPDLWEKLNYIPTDPTEKKIYKLLGLSAFTMKNSACIKFLMEKIYLKTGDEILIKKGSRARLMAKSWYLSFLFCILFIWIGSLVRDCKGVAPKGFGAVWDCLIAIP